MRRFFLFLAPKLAAIDVRMFYVGLAIVLGVIAITNFALNRHGGLQRETYDWMIKHRFHTPVADPDIVILDIDEKSLAQMSEEFGRWPWPRDVLGAVLAELESQGAQAVVFDILFSDPDKINAASDKAFSDAIDVSHVSFFPVLRLNPDNDRHSLIKAKELHGLVTLQDQTSVSQERTLAVAPPFFEAAVSSGRLGVHNIYPDKDGLIRMYRLWEDVDGWRIDSLPQRMAREFGWANQQKSEQLIQWMAKPLAFTTMSFSDVYQDSQRQKKKRSRDEFKGKIVLIGSTASSLFDVKGTPLASIHPGVDVLATAIDNAKNQRFLQTLPEWVQLIITLALLILMVWLTIRYTHGQLKFAFVIAPTILLLMSYLSLNWSNTFFDLSDSASTALLYFSLAEFYNTFLWKYRSGQKPFSLEIEPYQSYYLGCLAIVVPDSANIVAFETKLLNMASQCAPNAILASNIGGTIRCLEAGSQRLILATWMSASENNNEKAVVRDESANFLAALKTEMQKMEPPNASFLEREIGNGLSKDQIAQQMRKLVADTLSDVSS